MKRQSLLVLLTVVLVGLYYHWCSRITGAQFTSEADLPGYYNYLGRSLLAGKLSLPVEPAPELLALPDPWDPQKNGPWRLHDAVLFEGKHYLYHGGAPALLLFAPWRKLTGRDLPHHFGLLLIVFAAFLFWTGAIIRVAGMERANPLVLVCVALCSGVPYLLNRVEAYEIAIGGGLLCVAGGMFFLTGRQWIASGIFFGMALACRPHMAIVGLLAAGYILWTERGSFQPLLRFCVPLLCCFGLAAAYNYARFRDPLEFGVRYLLAGDRSQQHIVWSLRNIPTGLYYYLWSPPELEPVFPWLRLTLRFPWPNHLFPPNYFLEATMGVLFAAPVVILAFRSRQPLAKFAALSGVVILIYLLGTGLTTHRYFLDFVPLLLFAAVLGYDQVPRWLFVSLALVGCLANMALGVIGPYDDYLRKRPDSYLRLAGWFSPLPEHRPVDLPSFRVTLSGQTAPMPDGIRQPLLSVGRQVHRYVLYQEHARGQIQLISHTDAANVIAASGLPEAAPHALELAYDSPTRVLSIRTDASSPVQHATGRLITAPSQIRIGEQLADYFLTVPRFVGKVEATAGQIPR
ncbi:MAG: hypothetical protein H7039_18225 [Bryobacteraceae bacterium]|nr:hypothetical protein [Bryobacteraceae bacterium]